MAGKSFSGWCFFMKFEGLDGILHFRHRAETRLARLAHQRLCLHTRVWMTERECYSVVCVVCAHVYTCVCVSVCVYLRVS